MSLNPYGLIRRNGTPATSGLYILHEGPLGVFDETLNEQDYDDLRDAGAEGIVIETEENGGWIGITDKYWLAALMPAQNRHALYSMRALGATRDTYQTDLLGDAQTLNRARLSAGRPICLQVQKRLRFWINIARS